MNYLPQRNIHINSTNAISINNLHSKATFQLSKRINVPTDIEIYMALLSAEIPCSFYNISSINNTLIIDYNGIQHIHTIYPQNLNVRDLQTILNQATIYSNDGIERITTTFNASLLKFTLTSPSPFSVLAGSSIAWNLGFPESIDYAATFNDGVYSLTSTETANLSGTTSIYVRSNIKTNVITTDIDNANVISRIPVLSKFGGIVNFYTQSPIWVKLSDNNIDQIEISLTDSDGELIDFNNGSWTLEFLLDFRYKIPQKDASTVLSVLNRTPNILPDVFERLKANNLQRNN